MTADEFRRAALALSGVVEAAHMNHPDTRVKGKIFPSLDAPDECWGMIKKLLQAAYRLTAPKGLLKALV